MTDASEKIMLDNVATLVVNNISIYKSSVFFMVLGELIESVVVFGHIRASELQRRFFKDLKNLLQRRRDS